MLCTAGARKPLWIDVVPATSGHCSLVAVYHTWFDHGSERRSEKKHKYMNKLCRKGILRH